MARNPFKGSVVIAASGSLSTSFDTKYARVVNIYVPTWADAAEISFQVQGRPGDTFLDLHDELGQEYQLPSGTHNRSYPVPGLSGVYAVKVRSGLSGSAQAQTNEETIDIFGTR